MDITLVNYMKEQLRLVSLDFKRYMYNFLGKRGSLDSWDLEE